MAKTKVGKKPKGNVTSTSVHNQQNLLNNNVTVIIPNSWKRQQKARVKRVSWRDEQLQSMSVGEIDPAILFVRERVKIKYSREQLFEIGKNPASKNKPEFLDPNEVCISILDPEKWNLERKKSDTPETGTKGTESSDLRRRPGDPRERIRKENDGIVLSPQRRSFNSGCFVPANKEPLGGKNEPPHVLGVREISSSIRRIGSGRIMRDSWDTDKDSGENDIGFGRGQSRTNDRDDKFGDRERNIRDEYKFGERRSFGREIDTRDKDKDGRRNTRYSESRRRYSDNNEEPEWYSSGPISQNDTIELRGFDEPEKMGKKKLAPSRVKRAKDWSKKKESQAITEEIERESDEREPKGRSTPNQQDAQSYKEENGEETSKGAASTEEGPDKEPDQKQAKGHQPSQSEHMFNFEEFLKCESLPGLLTNGVGGDGDKATSRFSRWFKKDSPNKELIESSRRSSIQEDNHIIKDLLKDINESSSVPVTIHTPNDSNAYFAPISPAANTNAGLVGMMGGKPQQQQQQQQQQLPNMGQQINIMEMLARGKQAGQQGGGPDGWNMKAQAPAGGKILSLDELEAKIRQKPDHPPNIPQKAPPQKPDEETTAAFKRLLQQAGGHSGPQNGPMNKPQAMSLLEMLNHSQQQDEARLAAAQAAATQQQQQQQLLSALHSHQQPQPQIHNDLTLKLQQAQLQKQQMDMFGKLMSAGAVSGAAPVRASPLLDMGAQQSRDLLSRPEAQAILQGLKRGEITIQHLYQQLANPALQPRHREMLVTILKLHGNTASYGPSPRVLSPAPLPHHLYQQQQQMQQQQQQQQQQLRVSPLPPNAYCVSPIMATSPNHLAVPAMHQRIPSPRELQVHTQNILQRALIKKKLEEQTENFRKKQEMHRGSSPNPAVGGPMSQQMGGPKGVSSPTPLAFTPTSVLRKMTAEKDEGKENKAVTDNGVKPPGRPLTGMRQQPQVTVSNQQWNPAFPVKQGTTGRPIVKANTSYPSQTPDQFFAQLAQQQQPQPQQRIYQTVPNTQQRKPIVGQQYSQGPQYGSAQPQYTHPNPQSFSQPTPQQLRAQHQHRSSNPPQATQQGQQPTSQQPSQQVPPKQPQQQPMGFPQGQQQGTAAWQQFLNSAAQQQNPRPTTTQSGTGHQSGSLSPSTTNQLTRWFSPDLLERARGGELPSTANLARHALSLEEIERQSAPTVHN